MAVRNLIFLLMGCLMLALGGCATKPDETGGQATGGAEDKRVVEDDDVQPQPATIEGTGWLAVRIYGQEARAGRATLTIDVENGAYVASGSTSCNNYRGDVEFDGVTIRFGLLAATRKLCQPAISGQEQAFLEALEAARYWARVGSTLKLLDENNQVIVELIENTSSVPRETPG